jgi:hypothetical protein
MMIDQLKMAFWAQGHEAREQWPLADGILPTLMDDPQMTLNKAILVQSGRTVLVGV